MVDFSEPLGPGVLVGEPHGGIVHRAFKADAQGLFTTGFPEPLLRQPGDQAGVVVVPLGESVEVPGAEVGGCNLQRRDHFAHRQHWPRDVSDLLPQQRDVGVGGRLVQNVAGESLHCSVVV